MGGPSQIATKLAIFQIITTLVMFGIFWGIRSFFKRHPSQTQSEVLPEYEVFHRDGVWSAYRLDESFQLWAAILYAGFFYWWTPVLVCRYGWAKAVLLVVVPFAGIPIAGLMASRYAESGDEILIAWILVPLIRCMLSIQIGISSVRWVRQAQIARGWTRAGQCTATDAEEAIRVFNPPEPKVESKSLLMRLREIVRPAN